MGQEPTERGAKLEALAKIDGFESVEALLDVLQQQGIVLGICMNPECTFTVEVEAEEREGFCVHCGTNTVQSMLVLAGRI